MTTQTKLTLAVAFTLLHITASVSPANDVQSKVTEIIAQMPTQSTAETDTLAAEIVRIGPAGIKAICQMLVPPGTGDDTTARFALNSLATWVNQPGTEADRAMYVKAVIEALESASDNEVKAFLIHRLQQAGKDECVAQLSKYLTDPRLCEPATQALLTIRTPAAAEVLLRALPSSDRANRVTIIQALGILRAENATAKIAEYANSTDTNTRHAALYAIANIPDPSAGEILAKASRSNSLYERAKCTSYYLLFAQRLAETGQKRASVKICRDLIETRTDEQNVQCAALSTLVFTLESEALDDLLNAMDSTGKEFRAAALKLAAKIPGKSATTEWTEKMAKVSPEAQGEIASMLANRGDQTAIPTLLKILSSENTDKNLKLAAIPAVARLGGKDCIDALLSAMKTDQTDQIAAVKDALIRLSDRQTITAMANALPDVSSPSRVAILEVLAVPEAKAHLETISTWTKNNDRSVRIAAIKALGILAEEKHLSGLIDLLLNADSSDEQSVAQKSVAATANRIADPQRRTDQILTAIKKTTDNKKAPLLQTLAFIGGDKALQVVITETKSTNADVADAAIRTLADWPDAGGAITELINIARNTRELKYQVLSLRGCVRLVATADLTNEDKLDLYKDAIAAAERAEEKKLILAGLADVPTIESLKFVATYLDDKTLQAEAALAAVKIACPQRDPRRQGLQGDDVHAILKKVIAVCQDEDARKRAQKYVNATIP